MKIKDIVFTIQTTLDKNVELGHHYTISAIETDSIGNYYIELEGLEGKLFPEEFFTIVKVDVENPKAAIITELQHWRSEWIGAENEGDEEKIAKAKSFLDFFLDKLLLQNRFDREFEESIAKSV